MNRTMFQPFDATTDRAELERSIATACRAIAPTWPLDRFIAVNPHWGRVAQTFDDAGQRLARVTGGRLWMPREYYRERWEHGEITRAHVQQAVTEIASNLTVAEVIESLGAGSAMRPLPLLTDCIGSNGGTATGPQWRETITHQVSQHCASYFDADQSDWKPGHAGSLYAAWLDIARHDHGVSHLMRAPHWTQRVQQLPPDPMSAIALALTELQVPRTLVAEYLEATLDRIGGWAAWCAYRRWRAELAGGTEDSLHDLLAIRVASEWLADDGARGPGSAWQAWQVRLAAWASRDACPLSRATAVWQRAHEIAYQQSLLQRLSSSVVESTDAPPRVQAAFCIDVRSEVFRRALEWSDPSLRTIGFAGFFGLPIDYTPLGTSAKRPQLPGLLSPALSVTETSGSAANDQALRESRAARLRTPMSWAALTRWPASAFAWVETMGLAYAGSLLRRTLAPQLPSAVNDQQGLREKEAASLRLALSAGLQDRAALAARILQAMGLTSGFARLVLLAGHGSTSANNAHAAGLDCGACCGQTGEVNARALATLLNDAGVRRELGSAHGITLTGETWFVAALHDTTLDEVRLFDTQDLPATHRPDLDQLKLRLAAAGQRARAERAPALGLSAEDPDALLRAIRRRASDWAETRPEWGLANNAAFIAAPRARTKAANLEGRAFLHDYDWRKDPGEGVLELIMTAPVVVAHWINLQYFASTVEPRRFGSGTKVLHNVVGGRLGVFEGNGGDLRIGLPLQSVHDGQRWMHEPLRLSVFIAAPRDALERVIARHEVVRNLVENRWIHLYRFGEEHEIEQRIDGAWSVVAVPSEEGQRAA
jgi:uncharacterized protein YbcC (UPF0753/DUF2309 family)